jgi:hypothetical protein
MEILKKFIPPKPQNSFPKFGPKFDAGRGHSKIFINNKILGPIPLPFIGNGRIMAKAENIFDLFHQWTKTYGPVHTFWMGEDPIVAVADYKLIEETFLKDGDAYAGRPITANFPAFLRSMYKISKHLKSSTLFRRL